MKATVLSGVDMLMDLWNYTVWALCFPMRFQFEIWVAAMVKNTFAPGHLPRTYCSEKRTSITSEALENAIYSNYMPLSLVGYASMVLHQLHRLARHGKDYCEDSPVD